MGPPAHDPIMNHCIAVNPGQNPKKMSVGYFVLYISRQYQIISVNQTRNGLIVQHIPAKGYMFFPYAKDLHFELSMYQDENTSKHS